MKTNKQSELSKDKNTLINISKNPQAYEESSHASLLSSSIWRTWDHEDTRDSEGHRKNYILNDYFEVFYKYYPIISWIICVIAPVVIVSSSRDFARFSKRYQFNISLYDMYIINNLYLMFLIYVRYKAKSLTVILFLVLVLFAYSIAKIVLYSGFVADPYGTSIIILLFYFTITSLLVFLVEKIFKSEMKHSQLSNDIKYNRITKTTIDSDSNNENYKIGLKDRSDEVSESLLNSTSMHHSSDYPSSSDLVKSHNLDKKDANETSTNKKSRDIKASVRRLFSFAQDETWYLVYGSIALIISSSAQLAQPLFFGKIIQVCSSTDGDREDVDELTRYTVIVFIILAIGSVATTIRGYFYTIVGERIVKKIRKLLFDNLVRQDVAFFDINKTGELVNRLSSDTAVIQSSLSVNISMGLRAVAMILVSIVLLFITSWKLTLVMMGVVPVLVIAIGFYGRLTKKLTKEYQDALGLASERGTETISNIRITRSFGAELLEMWRYGDSINKSYKLGATRATAYGVFVGGLLMVANTAILIVVYYGARLVISGELEVGDLTSFILYTLYIAMGLGFFGEIYTELMNAVGASERIFDIIDTKSTIPIHGGIWPNESIVASQPHIVEFNDVSFCYPTRKDVKVLSNFTLRISSNQTVALVGPSGSGKSTVLSLLERFYDVDEGNIIIAGMNIKVLDPRWLHQAISIVPQEPVLFSGSIVSNIAYSKYALNPELVSSDELLANCMHVAKLANAHDFIMSFPDGYDTIVGERGVRLSGGQKQRIAIARALLADPKILLLDEATSALDSESEHLVQDAIEKLMKNRTVIVIAHRLSTVRDADVIAVVRDGSILDMGRHEELLEKCEVYANLVKRQLSWSTNA